MERFEMQTVSLFQCSKVINLIIKLFLSSCCCIFLVSYIFNIIFMFCRKNTPSLQEPNFHGRRVVTLHNQRDFIFFRQHRYIFDDVETARLQECGPRFTLKMKSLQSGLPDAKHGEFEFIPKVCIYVDIPINKKFSHIKKLILCDFLYWFINYMCNNHRRSWEIIGRTFFCDIQYSGLSLN